MPQNNIKIDLLGLKCPLPVLKANKLLKEHKKGDIIELLVDDIAAPNDFKIYCETKKYKLLSIKKLKHIIIKIMI